MLDDTLTTPDLALKPQTIHSRRRFGCPPANRVTGQKVGSLGDGLSSHCLRESSLAECLGFSHAENTDFRADLHPANSARAIPGPELRRLGAIVLLSAHENCASRISTESHRLVADATELRRAAGRQPSEHIALTKTLQVADILNQYAGLNKDLHPRQARQLKSTLAKL